MLNVNRYGNKHNFLITGVSYAGNPKTNTAMYITKKVEYLIDNLMNSKECLVFIEEGILPSEEIIKKHCIVTSKDPQKNYIECIEEFKSEIDLQNRNKKYILTPGGYYTGENVVIGEGALISPGCLIGHDVKIGKNATICSGVKILNAIIGNNFLVEENSTIGTNAFVMYADTQGNKMRVPSFGMVKIGNNVAIGSLSNIARGSAGDTVIEDHTKIDALCFIAHDVKINQNAEIIAGSVLGGFAEIGENAFVGMNATVKNRKCVGINTIVGMGGVVVKNTSDDVIVIGNPAKILNKGE